jgi:hypothetical protein
MTRTDAAGGRPTAPRVAYNPIPWAFTADGYDPRAIPAPPELAAYLKPAGFHAVQSDVPEGMTAAAFGDALRSAGLEPAPGYFSAPFANREQLETTVDSARRTAAEQAELGLTELFLADELNDVRKARPGEGVDADDARISRIAEHVGLAAAAMVAEGVRPCLHPHAGTWIETADETETVLASVDADHLLLGPDNGHLTWRGQTPSCSWLVTSTGSARCTSRTSTSPRSPSRAAAATTSSRPRTATCGPSPAAATPTWWGCWTHWAADSPAGS